ncbi:alpha/beta-hydrolase [Hesseltinella vesiculosa]|uniref:Alpha/beta-hydrolase n=1 Tax=Hesseltinella vesiculosa TaxID=101127 RepID=A0A1X2G406_9FUNG|nr:alpha/beta-hydrolase [Hesseltinella vesiculosa]
MSATVVDEWIAFSDGYQVFTKTWKVDKPVADFVIFHGFGEHCARYEELCQRLAAEGVQCHGIDERGFGETAKKHHSFGNNQGYDIALKDVNETVNRVKQDNVPLFVYGHSMGGGLLLNYLARTFDGVSKITGAIASAPLVRLQTPVPALKYYPLKMASYVLPSMTTRSPLDASFMSHDPEEVQKYISDPLVNDFISLGTARSILEEGENILQVASRVQRPILFSHGTGDMVNSYDASKLAFDKVSSSDKQFKSWKDLKHELHLERQPEREQVIQCYIDWVKAHL